MYVYVIIMDIYLYICNHIYIYGVSMYIFEYSMLDAYLGFKRSRILL